MNAKRVLLALVILGAGGLLWLALSRNEHYTNYPPLAAGPWVAFGDSLTEGFGASEGNNYPAVLERKLGVKIQNLGRSGETTADGLQRLGEVAALQPRVVLLCFGGNDSLNEDLRTQTFLNLARIIDAFHREGSFVVLIGNQAPSALP